MALSRVILASASPVRARLLRDAGVTVETRPARIDEAAIRAALEAESAGSRDVADALAEFKARKIAERMPDELVIGCDQVLEHRGRILAKPQSLDDAHTQLLALRASTHSLLSAAVIYHGGEPVWRHVGEVRMTMRPFSPVYLDDYLSRNWHSIRDSVGCYKLEEEGIRLISAIEGDYFNVLGLPLMQILNYLSARGDIAS